MKFTAGSEVGRGRFRLIHELGRGGMGVVWLAQDTRLGEPVALKFLPPDVAADPVAVNDLRRETARCHRLTHPNIIRIHDFHEHSDGGAFLAMEYVAGPALSALRLQQPNQVFSWERLAPLAQQLCAALDYAHGEGVVHRDLKPANVMLDRRGRVKLADFGVAAVVCDSVSRVTGRGSSGGTLPYMSPQQLRGLEPAPTDDVYALGATLYELLAGRPPFFRGDIVYQVIHEPPQPLDERLSAAGLDNPVPAPVAALLMACLAKQPEQRPAGARTVAAWLEGGSAASLAVAPPGPEVGWERTTGGGPLGEEGIPEATTSPGSPRRRILWLAAAAGVLLALGSLWAGWLALARLNVWHSKAVPVATSTQPNSPGPPSSTAPAGRESATVSRLGGLDWFTDLAEAQRRATLDRKTVLLAAGLDDCEPCRRIRGEFLHSQAFHDFAQANLILAAPPAPALQAVAQNLEVNGRCTLVAWDPASNAVLELSWPPGGAGALLAKLDEFVYALSDAYWHSQFDVARAKARAAGRLLVVHHSRDDCPGCLPLIQGLYTQPHFTDYAGKNLVLARVGFPPREPGVQQQCRINGCCEVTVLNSQGQWLWESSWADISRQGGLSAMLSRLDEARPAVALAPSPGRLAVSGELKCAACQLRLARDCQLAIEVGAPKVPALYLLRGDSVSSNASEQIGLNLCQIPRRVTGVLQSTPVEVTAGNHPVYAALSLAAVGRVPFVVQGETACLNCLLKKSPACQLVLDAEYGPWRVPYYVESGPLVERAARDWCQPGHAAKVTLVSPANQRHADGHWLFTPTELEFIR